MNSPRQFAIVFFILIQALSACNSPEPTELAEANTNIPSDTSAEPATEAAVSVTETSLPATEASLQLEIVETHIWTDQSGQFQADVLARNPYDFPVSEFESFITFYDSEGKELLQGVWFKPLDGGLGQILPGETVPAVNCLWCSLYEEPDWDSYEIIIRVTEAAPIQYSKDLEIVVERFTPSSGNYYELVGTVTNRNDQLLHSIFVSVIVRDQDGNFVGTGESTVYTPEGAVGIEPGVPQFFTSLLHASLSGEPVIEFVAIGQ